MIWANQITTMGLRFMTADRAAGAGPRGTSQKDACVKVLDAYKALGVIKYDPPIEKDYPGEVGEQAFEFNVTTRNKHMSRMVWNAMALLDNKYALVNRDAADRTQIDGESAGTALPASPVGNPG